MSLVWWLVVPAPSLHCHNQSSSDFLHKARNRLSSYTCSLPPTPWQHATTECSHCQASSFLMGKYWQNDIVCLDSVHGCASFFLTNRYDASLHMLQMTRPLPCSIFPNHTKCLPSFFIFYKCDFSAWMGAIHGFFSFMSLEDDDFLHGLWAERLFVWLYEVIICQVLYSLW